MKSLTVRVTALLIVGLLFIASAGRSAAAVLLPIPPIAQQTPEWCWAAASQMVLQYYGFPNLNPAGNYQCAVVGAQGGPCAANCGFCLGAGGTTQRIAAVIISYAQVAAAWTHFVNNRFHPHTSGIMAPQQIAISIQNHAPIIAGISPTSIPFPPGMGFSQHAVVIVGYAQTSVGFAVIINDPYPYPPYAIPYLQAGGEMIRPQQYLIPFQMFVQVFHYGNSITFN